MNLLMSQPYGQERSTEGHKLSNKQPMGHISHLNKAIHISFLYQRVVLHLHPQDGTLRFMGQIILIPKLPSILILEMILISEMIKWLGSHSKP